MKNFTESRTVELAVHDSIIDLFDKSILFNEQVITDSIKPKYSIVNFETDDFMEVLPIIQQHMPHIKVLMPIDLETLVKNNMKNHDT